MDEPRRLLEDSESQLEHALLRAGTSYRSSERARVRTLVSLGLAGSATLSAGSAFASSPTAIAANPASPSETAMGAPMASRMANSETRTMLAVIIGATCSRATKRRGCARR